MMGMNNNWNFINPFNMMNFFMEFFDIQDDFSQTSLESKNIKRKEELDVKYDIDRILHSNHELTTKNKDLETILNFVQLFEMNQKN